MLKEKHMSTKTCNHITYAEIKRYLNASEDSLFQDDLSFFEEFDDRLDTCDICRERFQAYALLSVMIDAEEDEVPEGYQDITKEKMAGVTNAESTFKGVVLVPTWGHSGRDRAIELFNTYLRQEIGEVKRCRGRFKIARPANPILMTRGANDSNQPITVIASQSEAIFEFELVKDTKVEIDMAEIIASEREYKLYLWRVPDGQFREIVTVEKGQKKFKTTELAIGIYFAVLVEASGNE